MELAKFSDKKRYKVIILGNSTVGKSSIAIRMVRDTFNLSLSSTIGGSYSMLRKNGYSFDIWDTAGQERYLSLVDNYYRGAKIALFVYDVTELNHSIERLHYYFEKLEGEDCKVIIIGNKCDLEDKGYLRSVETKVKNEFIEYTLHFDINYMFTSAKIGENINELVDLMVEKCGTMKGNDVDHDDVGIITLDNSSWWDYVPTKSCSC